MEWDNCTFDDDVYAELKRRISAALDEKLYPMRLTQEDHTVVATAWNQGIDAHLEALTERSCFESDGRFGVYRIHWEELPTLVRRLYEDGSETAYSLANGILTSLDIEVD